MEFGRRSLLVLALAGAASAACGGGGGRWQSAPLAAPGILITPERIWLEGSKLRIRTQVLNQGPLPIVVNRDLVTLTLPDGQTLSREEGSFGGVHIPYLIPPGGSHALYIDFRGGRGIRQAPGVQLNFNGAISANGQPLAVPPMIIQH